MPQVARPRVEHMLPEQQPDGHEVASQTQAPLTHFCPPPHAALVPQRHTPSDEQLSDFVASHCEHTAPETPQVATDGVLQVVPEQQPFGHETESHVHAPPVQR